MAGMGRLPPDIVVFERGWLSSNNVLLLADQASALVDTGYCTHVDQTLALTRRALGNRALATLANTHLHSDHCGGNAALQEAYPAVRTLIPPGLARHVTTWDPVALTYVPTGQQCPAFRMDGCLIPGSEVPLGDRLWQVHGAPGHDPHSIILFEPRLRLLVSADTLWEHGFGVVFQELEGESAFDEVSATFDLIEKLQPETVIPGHGTVFGDVASALVNGRRRLDAFVRDPQRHARHAAKVLVKFKLLELQSVPIGALIDWARQTAYFRLVHGSWFADQCFDGWLQGLVDDLVRSGAAAQDQELVLNS